VVAEIMNPSNSDLRSRIDQRLDELVPSNDADLVVRSMRYSLLAPGKRLRPLMTVLTAAAFGGREDLAIDPGCAIEMIHATSLILDDLPSMDDAATRRGRASNHVKFGEDVAILAAFGLLNHAYAVIARCEGLPHLVRTEVLRSLTSAVGDQGVIAGQMADLSSDRCTADVDEVHRTHLHKTGSLFVAAVETGALVVGVPEEQLGPIRSFATNFGLSFQALDDLTDRQGTTDFAGEDVGEDADKATLVSALGAKQALLAAEQFAAAAALALEPIGSAGTPLADLARSLLESARRPQTRR
jgi:geranylgeranyl pyrophosphate synthase